MFVALFRHYATNPVSFGKPTVFHADNILPYPRELQAKS